MLSNPFVSSELTFLRASDQENSLYGAINEVQSTNNTNETDDDVELELSIEHSYREDTSLRGSYRRTPLLHQKWAGLQRAASQLPAIALVTLFHLMVGIPFGVSYFPVSWRSSSPAAALSSADDGVSDVHDGFVLEGPFPIPGKEALGIRMFLFSTIMGQLVMTFASDFRNCISLQMVENVPFCQSLTYIVVETQVCFFLAVFV